MKQRAFQWRRDKKMILQLWAVSSLYMAAWMPQQLVSLVEDYWDPNFLFQTEVDFLYLLPYSIHFIYPYIVLLSHPQEMLRFKGDRVTATVRSIPR